MTAPDQDVRDAILASRGANLAVEAGAGTGKTTLLVQRVLALLAGGTPLARLAIITFTRRAAADLESRLVRELQSARSRGEAWAAGALSDLPGASIGTTDAFCRALLADFALESSAPAGFALADEIAEDALRETAWTAFLARTSDAEAALFAELRELGAKPGSLRNVADGFLDHRDLAIAAGRDDAPPALLEVYAAALAPALALRGRCREPDDLLLQRLDNLERDVAIARAVGGLAGERVLLGPIRANRRIGSRQGRAAAWGGVKDEVVAALDNLEQRVRDWQRAEGAARAARVARWLGGYIAEYARLKRERGVVDFRDLSLATRDLLRADPAARRRLAARWDAVLLDEAQDSDPLQMEIAMLLAAAEPVPDDPFDATLSPGRLFLVGDPKQSIYRFRRADIELYARARAAVVRGGDAPAIRANFRSHPAILAFVNRLFGGWMEPPPGESYQASYQPLQAGTAADDPGDARVHLLLPDPALVEPARGPRGGLDAHALAESEADAVVRAVRRILGDGQPAWTVREADGVERPARPRDIAILVRRGAPGEHLLEALRRADVPAASVGSQRFHEREEIQTLLAILDAVVDPEDMPARFAALRSPALAVRDSDLVLRFGSSGDPWQAGVSPEAIDAERRLAELAEDARGRELEDLLEHLVEELALFPAFGLRPDGPARIESLRLVLEAMPALESAGIDSLPDLVQWLRSRSTDRPLALGEIEAAGSDAVNVLTIHKAKGLEFPIVILADLGGRSANPSPVVPDRASGALEFRIPGAKGIQSPGYEAAAERDGARRDAEEIRLLYVATTRARDHLVLTWSEGGQGFLEKTMLPARLGARPGEAPGAEWNLRVLPAAALPPRSHVRAIHTLDPEAVFRARRPARDLFGAAPRPPAGVPRRVLAVTDLAEPGSDVEVRAATAPEGDREEADARALGILVHAFLESADLETPEGIDEVALDRAFRVAAFAPEHRARIAGELRRVTRDPMLAPVRTALAAQRAVREAPFLVPCGDDLLSGTIDVLIEEPDGALTLVDYKTGRPAPGGGAPPSHRAQAALYAWAATAVTGRPVREARLLYLSEHPVRAIALPGEDLARDATRRLRALRPVPTSTERPPAIDSPRAGSLRSMLPDPESAPCRVDPSS